MIRMRRETNLTMGVADVSVLLAVGFAVIAFSRRHGGCTFDLRGNTATLPVERLGVIRIDTILSMRRTQISSYGR
jgi:hypothetical protein